MQRVDSTRYGEVENVAVSITDENGVDCWWNPVPGLTAAMLPRLVGVEVSISTPDRGHRCSWPEMNDMIIASCDKKRFNLIKSIKIEPETSILLIEVIQSDHQSDVQSVKCYGRKHSKERGPVIWSVSWPVAARWPLPVWGGQVPSLLLGPCSLDVLALTTQLRLAKYISTAGIVHSVNTIRWNAEIPGLLFASNLG